MPVGCFLIVMSAAVLRAKDQPATADIEPGARLRAPGQGSSSRLVSPLAVTIVADSGPIATTCASPMRSPR